MSDRTEPAPDPGDQEIVRVREARRRISERFAHDPYRLVAHYQERQEENPERILRAPNSQPA